NFGKDEDLEYAKALFEFSTKYNQVATQGVTPFYSSTACEDDQSFAAGFLYLATNDDKYNSFLKSHQHDPNYEHCWDNVYLGAAVLNGEINGDWSIPTKYADQRMQNPNSWYTPDGWGAARYNTSAQFIGMLLKKHGKADHTAWCKGQMDMILGKNPKNVCLVVGFNNVSAKYPHHEAASGLKGWDEYNAAGATFGPKGGHILTGALEGGFQDAGFQFKDELNDITSSEVGIDYNATLVAAAAGLYSIYETGQIDAKVNGVDRDIAYENPNTTPGETRTTASKTTKVTTTTTTVATSKRTEKVEVASGKKELDIKLNKAAAIEIGIKATPGVEFNGAFSYTDSSGQYGQFGNFSSTMGQDGIYKLSESLKGIDAMNDTVTFHIWYSKDDSAVVDSVALTYYDVIDAPKTTDTATTTTKTTDVPETTSSSGETARVWGDANLDNNVTIADAVAILQSIANKDKYSLKPDGAANADVYNNGDGITGNDALTIQQVDAGKYKASDLPVSFKK
ncbi:MAG: glycoside hydrolase family 9 protein, partial [Ruminococcus sp.]|nr:glycoside hydrolase family 9 protein [Ruminococcus sp.]